MRPAVMDEIGLLQRSGHQRHAVAACTDHLRQRFLGQNKFVAAGQIVCLQQTSCQPGFYGMRRVAPGGLLDLSVDCQPMPEQRRAEGRALVGRGPKTVDPERRGDAGHQDHRACQRGRVAKSGERAEDAVAADHRDLNVLAPRKPHDKGDRATMRQVGALERFVGFDQRQFRRQIDGPQMRADQFEVVGGQRRQKSNGERGAEPMAASLGEYDRSLGYQALCTLFDI